MKTVFSALMFSLLLMPAALLGQSSVSGTVTDQANAMPLPGVNVLVKGTTTGASTDFDGNYTLNGVNNGDIIVFSYLGFVTQEIVYNGETTLNITMAEDAAQLEEVLLIGYGSTTKQDATGAVDKVKDENFNKGAIVAPQQLLAGKAAGVLVTPAGGGAGDGGQIRIRGGASLSATNDPLIVVDGLPLDQRGTSGTRNTLNAINPEDIQDFVVLKDASATAIYGSRAANGVILITTKKGTRNQPLQVEYGFQGSVETIANKVDVLTAAEYRSIGESNSEFDTSLLGDSSTDWQDELYENAIGAIHNLTFSKGYDNFSWRVNYNNVNDEGTLSGDLYTRNAINTSFVQNLLDDDLKLTLVAKGIQDKFRFGQNRAIGDANRFDPTQSVFDENGEYTQLGNNLAPLNPIWVVDRNNNRDDATNNRVIANFNIDYRFWFLEELKFVMNLGIDYNETEGERFNRANPNNPDDFNRIADYSNLDRNQNLDFYFNYKTDLESIKTVMDVTAGYSFQEFYKSVEQIETGSEANSIREIPTVINRNALESYFARASFDVDDRFLVSVSWRRDGSSRFSEDNRYGNFPGASVGWKISNESWMEESAFSNLKLRGGWGVRGQQELGDNNYGYLGTYTPTANDQVFIQFGDQFVPTLRPEEFDPNLKWEETTEYNVGLDFGFFDNRLYGSIDAYYRETDDLLAQVPVPAGSNLSDQLLTNVASTESRGIEIALNGVLIQKEDMYYDMNFNVTFQEVEIQNLSLSNDPNFNIPQGDISGGTGNTIQIWTPGLDPTTFFVLKQVYDEAGNPIEGAYVDVNGDNQITNADRVPYKKATPDAFFGWTNNFSYKNLDVNFTFRGTMGNYVYNNVASANGNLAAILDAPGEFQPNAHADVLDTQFRNQNLFSDYYVQRADFIRLDNLSIGYTIPFEKVQLRASLTGQNLFVITDYEGLDPEIANGIDNNFYPRSRTYVLGLNLTF